MKMRGGAVCSYCLEGLSVAREEGADDASVEFFGAARYREVEVKEEDTLDEPVERHDVHHHLRSEVEETEKREYHPVRQPLRIVSFARRF